MPTRAFSAPHFLEEPGWTAISIPGGYGENRSYVSGEPEGDRIRVRYFRRDRDRALVGKAWFGPRTEGPPGHAHGGSIAGLLDEAMGVAVWLSGSVALSARLTVNFRRLLPLGTAVKFVARVKGAEGKKLTTQAQLYGADDVMFAEAEGLFIVMDPARFGDPLAGPTPASPPTDPASGG